MSNVLSEEKKQQVIALGRLGWSLRRIEAAVHIRRETVGGYLRAAGIAVRPPGGWGRLAPAKPANEVTTDFGAESAAGNGSRTAADGRSSSASTCEPLPGGHRARDCRRAATPWRSGRTWWTATASARSYQSVQRFVRKLQIGNRRKPAW